MWRVGIKGLRWDWTSARRWSSHLRRGRNKMVVKIERKVVKIVAFRVRQKRVSYHRYEDGFPQVPNLRIILHRKIINETWWKMKRSLFNRTYWTWIMLSKRAFQLTRNPRCRRRRAQCPRSSWANLLIQIKRLKFSWKQLIETPCY